ncbi:PEP-CTERM sorting domain-containing protein [Bradyrhizobium sp. WYCCWR 13023]|uniref:PEP-CTERM sorting domain-containing protein n=1 Tax=Bradyrhizobium zhengyangense TaxID=2911009 RepID=A0A9X1RHY1_9BRAD|nr:PEP-CTERM sorting domain-containing protein [Bradyrhizobium zhengyangense]MCG2632381.1 PEP-CTERM sorting domain-containing protein [Bradyrhizobium zhengyangense]
MRASTLALVALATVTASPAFADIIEVAASSIQGDNVLFNGGTQTGTTVMGQTQLGTDVLFTGTTLGGGNTIIAAGGQARIEGALDTSTRNPNDTLLLNSLNFSLAGGGTFNNLEFNVFGGTATSATFLITNNQGQVTPFTETLGNGQNFFAFQGIKGQSIASVAASFTGGGTLDLRQIRLDQSAVSGVPEPASWALLALGFLGLGFIGCQQKMQLRLY